MQCSQVSRHHCLMVSCMIRFKNKTTYVNYKQDIAIVTEKKHVQAMWDHRYNSHSSMASIYMVELKGLFCRVI